MSDSLAIGFFCVPRRKIFMRTLLTSFPIRSAGVRLSGITSFTHVYLTLYLQSNAPRSSRGPSTLDRRRLRVGKGDEYPGEKRHEVPLRGIILARFGDVVPYRWPVCGGYGAFEVVAEPEDEGIVLGDGGVVY